MNSIEKRKKNCQTFTFNECMRKIVNNKHKKVYDSNCKMVTFADEAGTINSTHVLLQPQTQKYNLMFMLILPQIYDRHKIMKINVRCDCKAS